MISYNSKRINPIIYSLPYFSHGDRSATTNHRT